MFKRACRIGSCRGGWVALRRRSFGRRVRQPGRRRRLERGREPVGGKNGTLVDYRCPAVGTLGPVWGTGVYTLDSRVCSAAVHAGVISQAKGGRVTIKILPGRPSYVGSVRHGVTSGSWGLTEEATRSSSLLRSPGRSWTGVGHGKRRLPRSARRSGADTGTAARQTASSAPSGGEGYPTSSSVCSAAVHAGQISVTQGGNVIILIQAGKSAYSGTVKNGVTSQAAGASKASFVFTKA